MDLWGNDDNITTFGTVSLSGNTVTGTGTTFTTDVEVGQVIRFGVRGGVGTYYGDAVITSVASTVSLTIGSTAGLNVAVFGAGSTSYYISELPKSTVLDHSFDEDLASDPTLKDQGVNGTATGVAGIGTDQIPVTVGDTVIVGDFMINDSNELRVSTVNSTTIGLAATISAGITTGDILEFRRLTGGYDKLVYGVATADHEPGLSTNDPYDLAHAGWVGVQTYVDMHGNLRVKSEVLVAMSGIQTGNLPYPTNA